MKADGASAAGEPGRVDVESVLRKIASAQEEAVREFSPDLSARADRPERRVPLLAPGAILIDWDLFERLLSRVLTILEEWCGEGTHPSPCYTAEAASAAKAGRPRRAPYEARTSEGAVEKGGAVRLSRDEREQLIRRAVDGRAELEKRGAELGADPAQFALAVRYALAPFFRKYARELAGELDKLLDSEEDLGGRCPLCDAEPLMAELSKEDGRRGLQCRLCGTRWPFGRLKCPFCGTEDQQGLGFLAVDGLEGYRADVCDACGRYVKTIDRRRLLEPVSLELADALTPELDEAAIERGYGLRTVGGLPTEAAENAEGKPL